MTALPPKGFVAAGKVLRAERNAKHPNWSDPVGNVLWKARHARGLHYQQVVEHALSAWADTRSEWFPKDAYPDNRIKRPAVTVEFGPWFHFVSANQPSVWRWCQPDAVVSFGNNSESPVLVLEIKLAFEPKAWWQLTELYQPVLISALARPVFCAAICKSFDPAAARGLVTNPWFGSAAQWLETLWRIAVTFNDARLLTCKPAVPPAIESLRFSGLPVLQWKRPSSDSASSESTARITSANQPKAR